jgi:hypothetical protein
MAGAQGSNGNTHADQVRPLFLKRMAAPFFSFLGGGLGITETLLEGSPVSIFSSKPEPLSAADRAKLVDLETRIETVTRGFYADVGRCLATIRDQQLYREKYSSFDAYCLEKWEWTRQHVARMIAAAKVAEELSPTGSVPTSERQARLIGTLPATLRVDAWQEAKELAGDAQPETAHVEQAVNKRRKTKKRQRPKEIRLKVPGALVVIAPGRAFTTAEAALLTALDQVRRKEAA